MPKIILASQSKARKKLLKKTGLKFKVINSRIAEDNCLEANPGKLVKKNALAKAKAVAKTLDGGVIIAADTIAVSGKKLIGKPTDINDAIKTIKLLSKKPHWVYSGLAVIDLDSKKTYTCFEKTKVFMLKLTTKQIKDYCHKFLPLDKAGSFDIQGPGGMFVEQIEGCFYNVVGLPLAKLVKIFSKIKIDVFNS